MAWLDYDGLLYFWQKIKAKLNNKVDKVEGKSDITAMYRYKGSVTSTDKLPTSGQTIGDVYDVGNGMNYAWNGSNWDALGEIFTITKITNTEIDTVLAS